MFFINKLKPVKVTAYTFDKTYYELSRLEIGSSKTPSWLNELPKYNTHVDMHTDIEVKTPTASTCVGIRQFLGLPIHVKMWSDVSVRICPNGDWSTYARPEYQIQLTPHPQSQYGNAYSDRVFLKLNSPWLITCDTDINFFLSESHYSTTFFRDNDIIVPPGILSFYSQYSSNVHLGFKIKPEPYTVNLTYDQPLTSLFAMTERDITLEHKLIGMEEFSKLNTQPRVDVGRYYKKLKKLKEFNK